jgi:hypothetical protein
MLIKKIVSGGQTGADRGGLDAAIHLGFPHGGWCPKGRIAEDGVIPEHYRLKETPTSDYLTRTEANVVDSDATLVFTAGPAKTGSLRTIKFAIQHGRAWHHVDLLQTTSEMAVRDILAWLDGKGVGDLDRNMPSIGVLNVAGSRESTRPHMQDFVCTVMVAVLEQHRKSVYWPGPVASGQDDSD